MPNVHRICSAIGILLHGRKARHPGGHRLPPKECWSGKSIRLVAEAGEAENNPEHVYDVLGVFLANKTNQTQLFGETICGVSKWALTHNVQTSEFAYLKDATEQLDLQLIRETVRHHKIRPMKDQIAFLVSHQMEAALWSIRQ